VFLNVHRQVDVFSFAKAIRLRATEPRSISVFSEFNSFLSFQDLEGEGLRFPLPIFPPQTSREGDKRAPGRKAQRPSRQVGRTLIADLPPMIVSRGPQLRPEMEDHNLV